MSETGGHVARRRGRRVAVLTGVMMGATLVALAGRATLPHSPFEVAWLACLVVLFAATEGFVIHLRVRRGAHAVSLSDVPAVLGLLAVDPFLVVTARIIGGGGSLLLFRGQRGAKLYFNMALVGVQGAVSAWTFVACGGAPGPPGPRQWFAAYAATLLADVVAVVAVTAVIALHDDPGEWRRLPAAMRTVPLSAIATTVALVSAQAAQGNSWVLVLLAMLLVAVHVAYRTFVEQRQGKAEIEQLYAFTRALNGVAKFDDVLPVLLGQVRDQLRAGMAELVVPEREGLTRHWTVGADEIRTVHETTRDASWVQPALAGRPTLRGDPEADDAMAVPVAIGDTVAALTVTRPLPDSGAFNAARLRLLEALANHAGVALTKADLVERLLREATEKEHVALHDALSGLPNRRHFHTLLAAAIVAATADGGGVTVLVLDIDRFAEVNDALGHSTGDAVLLEVANRLSAQVADRGVVARIGGDEFAALIPVAPGVCDVLPEAAGLVEVIERALHLGPLTLHVRASAGVALAPADGTDADVLVRHADVAMYVAKRNRAGIQTYDQSLDLNTPKRLALIADLRRAINRGDVSVVFQPKVDPVTGNVLGAEALARWQHPVDGPIFPDVFIPLAEHSGLIRPLTLHVLQTALRERARWAEAGDNLHVAVNLSPNSLSDQALPDVVTRLLARWDTEPEELTLEITESTLMADPEGGMATLNRLHVLGVKLSIDDFGTGYSSLSRLRGLPIDEMKIDRSFVQRLAVDHRDRALVQSAIQMGHALELTVVAEGVEDEETMVYLAGVGCDIVQGYHISRPVPGDDFAAWLELRRIGMPTGNG